MADDQHPTRLRLLDTALELADDRGIAALSVDEVVRAANVAKGTFYVHFVDRADFLVALHQRFHHCLRQQMRSVSADLAPGAERLRAGTTAYLDGCRHATGVKAMLASARGEPAIADAVAASNDRFARATAPDFRALGRAHPVEAARLFVAMAAEVALLELQRGRRLAPLRQALWDYVVSDR
jgi:AcrR family transcriptional regulator